MIDVLIVLAFLLAIVFVLVKPRAHREDDPADDAYNGENGV